MSDTENGSNVISFKAWKAEKSSIVKHVNRQNAKSIWMNKHEADLYFHPSLNSLLGLDKDPDYIINVDPEREPDFEFIGGDKWPQTLIEDRFVWHSSKLQVGENYELYDFHSLKVLFGDLLMRCEHPKHVIEIDLRCHPKLETNQNQYEMRFSTKVNAIYEESVGESKCVPEFWFDYSQRLAEYFMDNYENKLMENEIFELTIRFNRCGLFWETERPSYRNEIDFF